MSLSMMRIPGEIKVGYQSRKDTYSKKLAYITYIDEKGKHRCEGSWNSWRDKKIDDDTFENEPMSGFVLNRNVGGGGRGWNHRQSKIRVYDPRGFEIEIGLANMLFVLEECSSIKGKGLEGEFVYAWDGKDLVLLPTSSQEYSTSSNFTALQSKKVTKSDMEAGCLYMNKDNDRVMYLGRHEHLDYGWRYSRKGKVKKLHIFKYMDTSKNDGYWTQTGFTKLAEKLTDEPVESYAADYIKYTKSKYYSGACKIKYTEVKKPQWRDSWSGYYEHSDGYFYDLRLTDLKDGLHDVSIEGRFKVDKEAYCLWYDIENSSRYGSNYFHREKDFEKQLSSLGIYEEKEDEDYYGRLRINKSLRVKKEDVKLVKIYAANQYNKECFELYQGSREEVEA